MGLHRHYAQSRRQARPTTFGRVAALPTADGCATILRMTTNPDTQQDFAVLWDLDGVLVDTSQYHFPAWRRLFKELGKELTREQFQSTFGMRDSEILARLAPGLSEEEIERLSARKEGYFREMLPEKIEPLPGAERLVTNLAAAGVPQAVASSTPRANLDALLPRLHLPIEICVGAEDVEHGKPDPQVFLSAAAKLGMPPWRCVVVEDAVAGIEAARRAGMASVAVATTWPIDRLDEADTVVRSLEELSTEDLQALALGRDPGVG